MEVQRRLDPLLDSRRPSQPRRPDPAVLPVRRWLVASPFSNRGSGSWLHTFVDPDLGFEFERVPRPEMRAPVGVRTTAQAWHAHLRHARDVWARVLASPEPAGVVTLFPQLAAAVGLYKRAHAGVYRRPAPILAWNFNLGTLPEGWRAWLARWSLAAVDRFVVHAVAEVQPYEAWLGGRPGRVRFVPLQQPLRPIEAAEDTRDPYVLAFGSAHRDYATFAAALAATGQRAVVVAAPHALRGVRFPPNVEVHAQLPVSAINVLVQRARLVVIPVDNDTTASGQVALLTAMMYGRAVIATRCAGTVDYVRPGIDGVLVPRGDEGELARELRRLWAAPHIRGALGAAARARVHTHHSDAAIAARLAECLFDLQPGDAPARTAQP